jgi:hypothetical protein
MAGGGGIEIANKIGLGSRQSVSCSLWRHVCNDHCLFPKTHTLDYYYYYYYYCLSVCLSFFLHKISVKFVLEKNGRTKQQQQQQQQQTTWVCCCAACWSWTETNSTCVQQIHREHAQPRISTQVMNSSVPKTQNSGEEINQTQTERERESLQNWQHKYNQILSATLNSREKL